MSYAHGISAPTSWKDGLLVAVLVHGRPARRRTNDIRDWSGMSVAHCTQTARNRQQWRKLRDLRPSVLRMECDDDDKV